MSKFTNKKFFGSVQHALRGLLVTIKSQRNFKYQILILCLICVIAYMLKYTAVEFCLCAFSIVLVLLIEMINSCIEFALDAVYKNKYSILVKMSKDISAGAVLLCSINCVAINSIIILSKVTNIFA